MQVASLPGRMDEARALRDKLEQAQAELQRTKRELEQIRERRAQEHGALQWEMAEVRRELATWRRRAELAEARERALLRGETPPPPPAAHGERPAVVHALVALVRAPSSMEGAMQWLAQRLELAPADVRLRLAGLAPWVVARLPQAEAEALCEQMRGQGLAAVSCEVLPRGGGNRLDVRRFSLEDWSLVLEDPRGERLEVSYPQIDLLMRGMRTHVSVTHSQPAGYGLNRHLLRELSRMVPRALEERRESQEPFLWLYGEGVRACFSNLTDFGGLKERLGPSRQGNMQLLAEELRRRAPRVWVDERLMKANRLSLPLVEQDRAEELLGELMWHSLRQGLLEPRAG